MNQSTADPMPVLTIMRLDQDLCFYLTSRQTDAPLPVMVSSIGGWVKLQALHQRLADILREQYHFYAYHARFYEPAPMTEDALLPLGTQIYEELVPGPIRLLLEKLSTQKAPGQPLLLVTNEQAFPWELAHDGRAYWGQQWAIGRELLSDHEQPRQHRTPPGSRILLAGNPTDDLPVTQQELGTTYELFLRHGYTVRQLSSKRLTKQQFAEALASPDYRLIHYSGHAVVAHATPTHATVADSGLLLAGNELLTPQEIKRRLNGRPWVFLNACNSAQTDQTATTTLIGASLAAAFVLGGAELVIGTLWPIPDEGANAFATALYAELVAGAAIGEALRRVRTQLLHARPFDPIWAAYVLYGDPQATLVEPPAQRYYPQITLLALQLHFVPPPQRDQDPAALQHRATANELLIAAIAAVANQFGGVTLRLAPTELLFAFGLPLLPSGNMSLPTDDHADRALGAAFAMQTTCRQLNLAPAQATADPPGNLPLLLGATLSAGVATGAAVINRTTNHYWGEVVDLATQLAQAAPAGNIWADEKSYQSVRQRYLFEPLLFSPVPAQAPPAQTFGVQPYQGNARIFGQLYGREQELRTLLDGWESAKRRRGNVIDLVGEAGIGKSHLAHELMTRLQAVAAKPLYAHCSFSEHQSDYALLTALLLSALELSTSASAQQIEAGIRTLLGKAQHMTQAKLDNLVSVLCRVCGIEIAGPLPAFQGDPELRIGETANALSYLFGLLADTQGALAMILEDLHYVDAASLAVLRWLVERMTRLPILCVTTYRPHWSPAWKSQTQRRLDPLDEGQSSALINANLSGALSPSLLREVIELAGGNGLFLLELLRILRTKGATALPLGDWSLRACLAADGISGTIQGVIQNRIYQLSPALAELLAEVAILGNESHRELALCLLTQHRDPDSVEESLHQLELLDFIQSDYQTIRFVHDLVHAEIVKNIMPHRRRGYHRQAAQAWTQMASSPENAFSRAYEQVAFHAYRSICKTVDGELRLLTAQEETEEYLLQVAQAALHASERARGDNAYQVAAEWAEKTEAVLALLADPATQQPLLIALYDNWGEVETRLGNHSRALTVLQRAFDQVQELPTPANQLQAADLARRLGRVQMLQSKWRAAEEWLVRGLALLRPVAEVPEPGLASKVVVQVAQLHIHRGTLYYWQGDYSEALASCQQGLQLAETQPAALSPSVAPEMSEALTRTLAEGYNLTGVILDTQGKAEASLAAYHQSLTRYEQLNDSYYLARVNDNLSSSYFSLGRWAQALQLDQEGLQFWTTVDDQLSIAVASLNLGMLCLYQGALANAARHFYHALQVTTALDDHRHLAQSYTNLGKLRSVQGEHQAAAVFFQKALDLLADQPIEDIVLEATSGLCEGALLAGDLPVAEGWATQALALLAAGEEMRMLETITLRLVGLVALRAGRLDDAARDLQQSLAVAESYQINFEVGRTCIALAELAISEAKKDAALAWLARACQLLEPMQALPALAQIAALRHQLSL